MAAQTIEQACHFGCICFEASQVGAQALSNISTHERLIAGESQAWGHSSQIIQHIFRYAKGDRFHRTVAT